MRGLLAFVRRLPLVTLLPQVVLAASQIGDDLPQFGHQHVGRCVAFHLRALAVAGVAGNASAGKTRNSSLGSIAHCPISSRVADSRPALMARRMVDLAQPVACEAVPRVKTAMVAYRSKWGVRGMVGPNG